MRVLVISSVFPSAAHPSFGIFVKERVAALSRLSGVELVVVAPTPYVPNLASLRRRYVWWKFPAEEKVEGIRVFRPRYLLPPKFGGYFHSELMYGSVKRAVDRLWREQPFDIIDSHFVYPNGCVATRLGDRYQVPVVVTGRGEDILRFPSLPLIGKRIRRTLQSNVWCVALSEEIAASFARHGARPDRITRIPNGIDLQKFQPIPLAIARRTLALPDDRKIIVSVGNLLERKGFHLLLDALSVVLKTRSDVDLAIVGGIAAHGEDYSRTINQRIHDLGLERHVRLVGSQTHAELSIWYNAADLFALLSSREGSPNVLLEALASGLPAVATPVGGIVEELRDPDLGILLPERSAAAAAEAILAALSQPWNRETIRRKMEHRDWTSVAQKVKSVLQNAIDSDAAGTADP